MGRIQIDEYYLSDNIIRDFVATTRKLPVATKEENVELKKRVDEGDVEAFMEMFYKNLRMVTKVASSRVYQPRLCERADLLQQGLLGLLKAIDQFDPKKGAFSNYSRSKIKAEIQNYLRNTDFLVYRPANYQKHFSKYQQIKTRCEMQGDPIPDDTELRKLIDCTQRELDQIKIDYLLEPISTSDLIEDKTEYTKSAIEQIDDINESITFKELLGIIKLQFTPYSYYILYRRFIDDVTFESIGKEFNVERQAINKSISRMLKRIRGFFDQDRNLTVSFYTLTSISLGNFKFEPVSPENVTAYLFVKDHLSFEESELLRMFVFTDDRKCTLPLELEEKVRQYIGDNLREYRTFHRTMIETYSSEIYDMALGEKVITTISDDKNLEMKPTKVQDIDS